MKKVSYFQIWGTYLPPKSPKKVLRNMWMVPYSFPKVSEDALPKPLSNSPMLDLMKRNVTIEEKTRKRVDLIDPFIAPKAQIF